MHPDKTFLLRTELDRTTWPQWREAILEFGDGGAPPAPRSYPGWPRHSLPRPRARRLSSLDHALLRRRCARALDPALPPPRTLGRLLWFAHGAAAEGGRGPVPSAGGLQALELFLAVFPEAWLPSGLYHYDRAGHWLSRLGGPADRAQWTAMVPSLEHVPAAPLLFVLIGDAARVEEKYGERGARFLLLEAGHLMQNLCLLSASLGLSTVPLGGFFERDVRKAFGLPAGDRVVYVGGCGERTNDGKGE